MQLQNSEISIGCLSKSSNEQENSHINAQKNKWPSQCIALPIYKQPMIQTKFFIIGDAFISLDPREEVKFIETIRLQNSYRPVKWLEKYLQKQFIRVQVDQAAQGIKDFRFLVKMMETMQDREMHKLSQQLEQYQIIVDNDLKQQKDKDDSIRQQRKQIFKHHQDNMISQILTFERDNNPFGVQVYELYDCVISMIDARRAEFGFNENYVHLIGTDMETISQFIMREGWFDSTMMFDQNVLTQMYFEKYLYKLVGNEEMGQYEAFQHTILTLDQILLPVIFQPSVYYLYSDNTYSSSLQVQNIDNVICVVILYNLDIDVKHIKKLLHIRQQTGHAKNNLLLHSFDNTLSQFQYEIQSDYFYNLFYQTPPSPIQKLPTLNDLFPHKICQYKCI